MCVIDVIYIVCGVGTDCIGSEAAGAAMHASAREAGTGEHCRACACMPRGHANLRPRPHPGAHACHSIFLRF